MKQADKEAFARKMAEMMYAFARQPEAAMVDSYYNQLSSLPLEYVLRGIDQAIRDKRRGDLYDQRTVPTVPEVAHLARSIMDGEKPRYLDGYCEQCHGTGWLLDDKDGRAVAHKCECLLRRIDQQRAGAKDNKKVFS